MRYFLIRAILFLIPFFAIERFCHKQTRGFRLQKITSSLPFNPDWEIKPSAHFDLKKVRKVLSQPYYFLNSGGEAYVFVSEDNNYVLKFFKHHHMRPKTWKDSFLPASFQKNRIKKLDRLFSSCILAYERFQEGTGLLFIHLNQTTHLNTPLKLYDPIGCLHKLDLDHYTFALQKKGSLAYPTLTALIDAQEIDVAKERLDAFLDLIISRCNVGLSDHDARKRNFGFIGNKAIEFDLGSFTIDETLKHPQERNRALLLETLKLHRYLKKNYPELADHFENSIKNRLS